MMNRYLFHCAAMAAAVATLGVSASAATVTVSDTAPVVDGADQAQLAVGPQLTGPLNPSEDQYDPIYIFSDRPAQGQSFTTGSNPQGYILDAVTLQQSATDTFFTSQPPFAVRITQLAGSAITPVYSETAAPGAIVGGADDYFTLTLATPQVLLPNTVYGFDVGAPSGGVGLAANANNPYAGGSAYSSGDNGIGDTTAVFRNGDRVFHVNLTAVPEPASAAVLVLSGSSLLLARRRRDA